MVYKIRDYRKQLGMSQEELSKKSGVSRTTISGLENGTIRTTTTDTLIKISESLGKSVSEIFLEWLFNKLDERRKQVACYSDV